MKTYKDFVVEGSKEEYQKFVKKKLKKFGVKSPADLKGDDKKKFYNEIDKEWESDAEEDGEKEKNEWKQSGETNRRCAGGDRRRKANKIKKVEEEGEDCGDEEE